MKRPINKYYTSLAHTHCALLRRTTKCVFSISFYHRSRPGLSTEPVDVCCLFVVDGLSKFIELKYLPICASHSSECHTREGLRTPSLTPSLITTPTIIRNPTALADFPVRAPLRKTSKSIFIFIFQRTIIFGIINSCYRRNIINQIVDGKTTTQ